MAKIKHLFVWVCVIFSLWVIYADTITPAIVVADRPKTPTIPQAKVESQTTPWLAPRNTSADASKSSDDSKSANDSTKKECDWIKLNTDFPLIWNCIKIKKGEGTDVTQAFPTMIWALTKIIISIILVVCFIMIIVAWIMRASDDPKWAKWLIMKVAITILLLWFSWVILKLINPNFFS